MHIVEAWGTGIPRIINRCKEYGLPEPLFEEFGDGFKVTIFRKVSNALEKVSNASEKISNVLEEVSNAPEKVSNASEKVSNAFGKYIPLFEEAELTDTFINNIEQVFRKCGTGIPFGQTNVMEWLDCSKSKATNIMNAMKAAKVIKKVTGLGPGKYEFVEAG
jgi:predicted HTH transcriptional regulator